MAHFGIGFAGEGDGEDLFWLLCATIGQELEEALDQEPGLAGAGRGFDDPGAPDVQGGTTFGGVGYVVRRYVFHCRGRGRGLEARGFGELRQGRLGVGAIWIGAIWIGAVEVGNLRVEDLWIEQGSEQERHLEEFSQGSPPPLARPLRLPARAGWPGRGGRRACERRSCRSGDRTSGRR